MLSGWRIFTGVVLTGGVLSQPRRGSSATALQRGSFWVLLPTPPAPSLCKGHGGWVRASFTPAPTSQSSARPPPQFLLRRGVTPASQDCCEVGSLSHRPVCFPRVVCCVHTCLCISVCSPVCLRVRAHVRALVCESWRTRLCVCACVCVCLCISMRTCPCISLRVRVHVSVCVGVHACVSACACLHVPLCVHIAVHLCV